MKYEEMSDFEINKRVALSLGLELGFVQSSSNKFGTVNLDRGIFNPCSNPSDAWPIIQKIWVTLMSPPYRGYGTLWDNTVVRYNCGKLRAAMICFLKMKDAER